MAIYDLLAVASSSSPTEWVVQIPMRALVVILAFVAGALFGCAFAIAFGLWWAVEKVRLLFEELEQKEREFWSARSVRSMEQDYRMDNLRTDSPEPATSAGSSPSSSAAGPAATGFVKGVRVRISRGVLLPLKRLSGK